MGKKIEFPYPLARICRKRQRLPSSRCIESAQTHRARVCSLLTRASDTTLSTSRPVGRLCDPETLSEFDGVGQARPRRR